MTVAYVMASGRAGTDQLLTDLAAEFAARGFRACGAVQINTARTDRPCDMDVRILPDGPVLRISQNLGRKSKGCRLDPDALETAVGLVEAALDHGADLLVINKFGKHEAEGRGFRAVIAEAVARDIPVVVGLNDLNAAAFHEFTGGLSVRLECDKGAITAWLHECLEASVCT